MLLHNLQTIAGDTIDITVHDGKIAAPGSCLKNSHEKTEIYFDDHIVFPGLINSHDHLDFNLFPMLGNKVYDNYVDWGDDIHKHNKDTINSVLKIPVQHRIKYGIYKNLLNGVTTVVNHGPKIDNNNQLITVFQECDVLHSVQLEKYLYLKLNLSAAQKSLVAIHIGEGTDKECSDEIDKLINWNFRKRDVVGIHGIAMNERQAKAFKALVWCPYSNYFLIGETAAIQKLKHYTTILFGTDSCVSSDWSIWEHLRLARKTGMVSDEELYKMTTTGAATTWQMYNIGKLEEKYDADVVIVRRKNNITGYDAYYAVTPEDIVLVMHKGKIRLFDAELSAQLKDHVDAGGFSKVRINGCFKYIYGDLPGLMDNIKRYYPEVVFPFLNDHQPNKA